MSRGIPPCTVKCLMKTFKYICSEKILLGELFTLRKNCSSLVATCYTLKSTMLHPYGTSLHSTRSWRGGSVALFSRLCHFLAKYTKTRYLDILWESTYFISLPWKDIALVFLCFPRALPSLSSLRAFPEKFHSHLWLQISITEVVRNVHNYSCTTLVIASECVPRGPNS